MIGIALDTNLMVLLCLGQSSRRYVGHHERIKSYTPADYDNLLSIVAGCDILVSTPFSLSQVSDLLNISHKRTHNREIVLAYRRVVSMIDERFVPSAQLCSQDEIMFFGLADTAWISTLDDNTMFYSTDQTLVNYAASKGKKAEWFRPSNQ
jgi:hypothetical protein